MNKKIKINHSINCSQPIQGHITCYLVIRCDIIRGGMKEYLTPMGPTPLHVNPIFEIGPVEPRFSEWLVFEGISVDESGRQHYLDASVAYKRAVLNAIDYLSKFGYSKEQVQVSLSINSHKHMHTQRSTKMHAYGKFGLK